MGASLLPAAAQNTEWPTKPLRLIVPFPAGGTSDMLGRTAAAELSKSLGQPVTVDNIPGAGGATGCSVAAKAPADGYTLVLSGIGSNAIAHALTPPPAYEEERDFIHISQINAGANVLIVPASAPIKTLGEMIDFSKKNPGKLSYAQVNASSGHLAMELLRQTLTTCVGGTATANCSAPSITGMPFAGGGPALSAVLDNKVSMMFTNLDAALPHLRSGKLRALAITSLFRSPLLPDVPSVSESGYPGFMAVSWAGVSVPAGTPANIVTRLEKDMMRIFKNTPAGQQLEAVGFMVMASRSADYKAFILSEARRWGRVVRAAGIKNS
ncbi:MULTISPECIES: tripartite tricarboxylate transporter substrate-binding protein [unclassified Acidovorax]|nr:MULTISPECIES: tripartite tricarboxylate transporter substrate-binding protein [unclassified Acidovorax]